MADFYDIDANAITLEQWAAAMESRSEGDWWQVGCTRLGDTEISTVWLGVDHGWHEERPLIFETMIVDYRNDERAFRDFQQRYSTKEEARAGHDRVVSALRAGEEP